MDDWKSYLPFFDSAGKFSAKEVVKMLVIVGVGLFLLNVTGLAKYTKKP